MTKSLWVWALLVSCICGWSTRASAEGPSVDRAPAICQLDPDQGHPGLNRTHRFARGEVVLTFDDGPQPVATKKLLDLLDEQGFKATFFVVGLWIRPDTYRLIQRMVQSGHEIGTHTYSHDLYLARRGWGVDYIAAQYELTHVLVELALLATSPEDFSQMYTRVMERKPGRPLTEAEVRRRFRSIERNHRELVSERGAGDERVYPMLFARPPGGIPYEGNWPVQAMRDEHEAALARLGLMNILWHGGSGDTVLGKLDDLGFLLGNMRYHTRQGGVILIHDRMRHDALRASFQRMASDPSIKVRTLRSVIEDKYSCRGKQLYAALQPSRL
jgi:peptidoglycan/xylan/chitin deacetylase (PgdA/CDA1 family)